MEKEEVAVEDDFLGSDLDEIQDVNQLKQKIKVMREQVQNMAKDLDLQELTTPGQKDVTNFMKRHSVGLKSLEKKSKDTHSPACETYIKLYTLEKDIYKMILDRFPEFKKELQAAIVKNIRRVEASNSRKRQANKKKKIKKDEEEVEKETANLDSSEGEEEMHAYQPIPDFNDEQTFVNEDEQVLPPDPIVKRKKKN